MRDPLHKSIETSIQSGTYVEELRRLLIFHGLGHGSPSSLPALQSKLANDNAFRTDLSAFAQQICDREHRSLSDDELLELIAAAAEPKRAVLDHLGSVVPSALPPRRTPLSGIASAFAAEQRDPGVYRRFGAPDDPSPPQEPQTSPPPPAPSHPVASTSAQIAAKLPEAEPRTIPAAVPGSSESRLELAITELKLYLDDIDRRMSRLEPCLEDISRIIRTSGDRLQQSHNELDRGEPAPAPASSPVPSPASPVAPPVIPVPFPAEIPKISATAPPASPEPARSPRLPIWSFLVPQNLSQDLPREALPDRGPASRFAPLAENPRQHTAEVKPHSLAAAPVHRTLRETAGRLLAVVAVLLAIVGCIAAVIAFRRPPASLTTAQSNAAPGLPAPAPALLPQSSTAPATPQQTAASARIESAREYDTSASHAQSAAKTLPQKTMPPATTAPAPDAGLHSTVVPPKIPRVASGDLHTKPRSQEPPPIQRTSREATALPISTAPSTSSRTASEVAPSKLSALPVRTAGAPAGTPQVESHSTRQDALIASRKPVYPPDAVRDHKEGTVVLNAFIAKDGTVRRVDVVEGAAGFTRSAMNAVSWWRYKPSREHGEPVESEARITLDYRLR